MLSNRGRHCNLRSGINDEYLFRVKSASVLFCDTLLIHDGLRTNNRVWPEWDGGEISYLHRIRTDLFDSLNTEESRYCRI
ncbi:hypothetical protein C7S15_4655 [Burkholderia cepacia]|nr:hypothetical protein [Burkholderia cepacia]